MNNYSQHQRLVDEILLRIGSTPLARVWKQNTGVGRTMDGKRIIRFGLPGAADITGIMANGHRLEIECKTGSGELSLDQISFKAMIEKFGGLYIQARDVLQVENAIKRALTP